MTDRKRLDIILMEQRGFARNYAREVIESGLVLVDGRTVLKPGTKTDPRLVSVLAEDMRYVSRGGYKLEAALDAFGLDLTGVVCMDAGASSGGFTDCMLKHGAARVYAIDTGRGQLKQSLRLDQRVISHEETDIRAFKPPETVGFIAADVSFISQTLIIPYFPGLLNRPGALVSLIKPQFEAGKGLVGKRGIVTDKRVRELAVKNVRTALAANGFIEKGFMTSPLPGGDGNEEYLIYAVLLHQY